MTFRDPRQYFGPRQGIRMEFLWNSNAPAPYANSRELQLISTTVLEISDGTSRELRKSFEGASMEFLQEFQGSVRNCAGVSRRSIGAMGEFRRARLENEQSTFSRFLENHYWARRHSKGFRWEIRGIRGGPKCARGFRWAPMGPFGIPSGFRRGSECAPMRFPEHT